MLIWVAVACAFGLASANPALTVTAFLLVGWFFQLLWRVGEPPILLLGMGYQWVQVTTKTFNADILGVGINELNAYHGDVELSTWLSIAALAVLALGMRLGAEGSRAFDSQACRQQVLQLSLKKLWWLYLLFTGGTLILGQFAQMFTGLTQIILALIGLKWAVFFIFCYTTIVHRRRFSFLYLAVIFELVAGVAGYFSGFKTVFFVLMIAVLAARSNFTLKNIFTLVLLGSVLIYLSLMWTAVKGEYRTYLSDGEESQTIVRSYPDRMNRLAELLAGVRASDLAAATQALADRASYVDFFGRVVTTVPRYVPHENGRLWLAALQHIVTPRLFFPDKPSLPDDSDVTNAYTGLNVAGGDRGTTISIGYVAETYVDFGRSGMFLAILALGFLWGRLYRYLISNRAGLIVTGQGLAISVLLQVFLFETAAVKLLGGIITAFLIAVVVQKFVLPKIVPYLRKSTQDIAPSHAT